MSEAPIPDQASAAARPRRTFWLLIAAGGLLLAFIASLPWLWARRIESAVFAELISRHGDDFAIIEMHVDGDIGDHLDLYRKLWFHFTTKLDSSGRFGRGSIYSWHHLAVLVSDNQHSYLYYWSLREDRLVLNRQCRLRPVATTRPWSDYRYQEADCDRRRGVRWKRNPDGNEIIWYHPSWSWAPKIRLLQPSTGTGSHSDWSYWD